MWARAFDPTDPGGGVDCPGAPDLVMVFGTRHDFHSSEWPARIHERFADSIVVGCSSGTMVDGATIDDETPVGIALGFSDTRVKVVSRATGEGLDDLAGGAALGMALKDPELAAVFLLSDGLSGNPSALVRGLSDMVGEDVAVSGGLAGDGPRFEDTVVLVDGQVVSDTALAIGFYGSSLRFSYGSDGGWETFGPTRTITASSGTTLETLDGAPALELYERYLGDEAVDLPASGLLFPLEIWDPAAPDTKLVRTLIGIDRENNAMNFAGDMPEGWQARLMQGTIEGLVSGATRAADRATADFGPVAGDVACLVVSCVGRRIMMGQRADDEMEEVASHLPQGTVISGFFSYGEIAPHNVTCRTSLHNQTMTLTMLGEAA